MSEIPLNKFDKAYDKKIRLKTKKEENNPY